MIDNFHLIAYSDLGYLTTHNINHVSISLLNDIIAFTIFDIFLRLKKLERNIAKEYVSFHILNRNEILETIFRNKK